MPPIALAVLLLSSLFVICWIKTEQLQVPDPASLYYQGYAGHPDCVFWMSVLSSRSMWREYYEICIATLDRLKDAKLALGQL